jgi:hypothetical protein
MYDWIAQASPRTPAGAPQLVRVRVEPQSRSLAPEERSSLRVIAEFSDGGQRDVTAASAFQSSDSTIASVAPEGVLQAGPIPGEAAIMARYRNHIAVCAATIPLVGDVSADDYERLPREHPTDALVWDKLRLLGMLPSPRAAEATFHRRAFLRAIGRLPTPDETRAYLADERADKREELVDRLLARPEYADFWANKWADLLRPNPFRVGRKAVRTLDAFLRKAFRENWPYDKLVRELVTARGSTWRNGATVIYRDRPEPV